MVKTYKSFKDFGADVQKKRKKAMKNASDRISKEVKHIIYNNFVNWYYEWGPPTMYDRTYQLYKSIGVRVDYKETKKGYDVEINFSDKGDYGPNAMDHSPYTITTSWITKDGKAHSQTYNYGNQRDPKKEKRIFENFLRDIHGFAGEGDFANNGDYAAFIDDAYDELYRWVADNAQRIFTEELKKVF